MKLLVIRDLCERALRNYWPLHTLTEIAIIAEKGDADHEYEYPSTLVLRRVANDEFAYDIVPHENHRSTQEQHCRDNPPPFVAPVPASDQAKLFQKDTIQEAKA